MHLVKVPFFVEKECANLLVSLLDAPLTPATTTPADPTAVARRGETAPLASAIGVSQKQFFYMMKHGY